MRSSFAPLLIPLAGLMFFVVFGVVPQYWISQHSFLIMIIGLCVAVCTSLGLALWKNIFAFRRAIINLANYALPMFFLGLLLVGLLYGASQYAVPGGIDSAIHANFVNLIARSHELSATYPLGLHIFILFVTSVFPISLATAFLSINVLLYASIFGCLYFHFYYWTKKSSFALLGALAGLFDASAYNNYLNGSPTHLLGTVIILSVIPFALVLRRTTTLWVRWAWWTIFFTTVFYAHFVTILFILPAVWLLRLLQRDKSWVYSLALIAAMISGIPLFQSLFADPSFSRLMIPATLAIVAVDVFVTIGYRYGSFLLQSTWAPLAAVALGILGFYHTYGFVSVLVEWYGPIIVTLSLFGIILILVKRDRYGYALIYYSLSIVAIPLLLLLPFVNSGTGLIQELVFYYGYTTPLIVLAGYAMVQVVTLVQNLRMRLVSETLIITLLLFIFLSRATNQLYFSSSLTVSRYSSNAGFGIFYARNDVKLAEWAKRNLPPTAVIANPGGLFNSWAVLSGHQQMYYAYDQLAVSGGPRMNKELQLLLDNSSAARPDVLLNHGVGYVVLPENFSTTLFHPQTVLLHAEGRSRLYQLRRNSTSDFYALNLLNTVDRSETVSLEGNFSVQCRYCGNRLYYQFEDTLKQLTLPSQETLTIQFDDVSKGEVLSLKTDPLLSRGEVAVNGDTKKTAIREGNILEDFKPTTPSLKVSIHNPDDDPIIFDSLVLLVKQESIGE